MPRVIIENERLRLALVPELGAGVAEFSMRIPEGREPRAASTLDASGPWQPLWRRAADNTTYFNDLACYVLAPWSNRIAGAQFIFKDREIRLAPNWPDGTAIHGVVKDRPWSILDRSPASARFGLESRDFPDLNWPWAFSATARYELSSRSLAIDLSVTNRSGSPMPAGLGLHPFFMRRLWDPRDDVIVRAAFRGRYPATNMIPTGPAIPDDVTAQLGAGRPLAPLILDDVFDGFDSRAEIIWPASRVRASFSVSPTMGHTVIYSPPAPDAFFCFEPVTMVNDGFNLAARGETGTGVVVLEPGSSLAASMVMTIHAE